MPSNTFTTYNAVGNREDLIDRVFMISPSDTPFTSAIDKTSAEATYHEWQTDSLRAPSLSNAAVEGADATYAAQTATVRLGNRTQVFQDTYSVSGSQDAVKKAGPKEIARLAAKKSVELKKDVEAAALANGTSVVGSTSVGRTMRGLKGWLATNFQGGTGSAAPVYGTNTAPVAGTNRTFTEAMLKTALLGAYTNGGNVSQLHVRPADKQLVSAFAGNATRFLDVSSSSKAQNVLTTAYAVYGSDFGNVSVIPNRVLSAVGDNAAYAVDTDMFALAALRGFQKTELAQTGDAQNFQILAEFTLECRNEASSAQVRDLS